MARRAIVASIIEALNGNSSRGVLIVGARGAGKTWMLGQLLAALGPDVLIIRLTASRALAAIPFGAVNARVGSQLVRSNEYYEVLNGLLAQIDTAATGSRSVFLMVDNAQHLDKESAAVILQVVMSTQTKLILVDQPGSHKTFLRELWRDGHLTRFELPPLQPQDVRFFLEQLLGGKVARATAAYLASRSAGNPLILQGLVVGAQQAGSLRKIDNVWILDHPDDRLSTESWEFLEMDLDHLPVESRRIIEILALAGPLELNTMLHLSTPEALDDIQQRELVEVVPGVLLTMRLARQATASAIRGMVPIGRSRGYLAEVLKVMPTEHHGSAEEFINFTRWSLDCGLPVPEEQILTATVRANQLMRPIEALQFSNYKVSSENAAALLAERSIAHLNQNSLEEARTLALQALELAASAEVASRALHAVHLSHASEADYEVRFNEAFARYESRFGAVVLSESCTRSDVDVLMVLACKDVSLGKAEKAAATIEGLLEHPLTANASDKVLLQSLHCEILCATGQLNKAVAIASEVIRTLESPAGFPRPDIAILAYARSVAALIYDGAWDYASAALDPATFTNPDMLLHAGGMRDLGAAMMQCRRGHMEEALMSLESAVGILTKYDPWLVLPTALGLLAYCSVLLGDIKSAQESLVQLTSLTRRSEKFYELEGAAYGAAALFMSGQQDAGLARLNSLQQECQTHGYLGIELTVLSLMVRLGDTTAIARMAEAADMFTSSSKEFFVNWAAAIRAQDPSMMDRASTLAEDYGFELIAVELATHALKKFHDGGKVYKSRKTASKVVAMREQLPRLVSPVFQTIDQPKMTRREYQIALFVAQGESNNAIASRLNVSLRTVEGHLYRTFIKLDIQSREQLAGLINVEPAKVSTAVH